jgi:hypothetical protein
MTLYGVKNRFATETAAYRPNQSLAIDRILSHADQIVADDTHDHFSPNGITDFRNLWWASHQ